MRLIRVCTLAVTVVASTATIGVQTISPNQFAELAWRCIGPFDGGPVASVEGVAGQPGVYTITTPSGGAWKTIDGGGAWTTIDRAGVAASTADPHQWVDPANPRRIVRTDPQGIEVSLDSGRTWTASHNLPIAEVATLTTHDRPLESIADPSRAGLKFAATATGVNVSFDAGAHWESLRLNMPSVAITDLEIRGNNLVAATKGRSVWMLDDISPLRQITAAVAAAPLTLFKPADVVTTAESVFLDYIVGPPSRGAAQDVTLEVLDPAGRVVHTSTSAPPDTSDLWLPVIRPLSATPGHHRVMWDLRVDPPASPHHRYAQAARTISLDMPPDPDGPRVLAGSYRVRLTAGAVSRVQPLILRNDPKKSAADLQTERQSFQLAMKSYDATQTSHRAFLQTTRVRNSLKPLLLSNDVAIVIAAAQLYIRLASLDGSDWTGLVIPDAPEELDLEEEEVEVKHPDFVPPKPVSVSKDYDDPASILGRLFENVNHAPALLILSGSLGEMLTKTAAAHVAPDALALGAFDQSCQELAGVLDSWRAINAQDLPRLNAELAKRNLPSLPVASTVPTLTCGAAR